MIPCFTESVNCLLKVSVYLRVKSYVTFFLNVKLEKCVPFSNHNINAIQRHLIMYPLARSHCAVCSGFVSSFSDYPRRAFPSAGGKEAQARFAGGSCRRKTEREIHIHFSATSRNHTTHTARDADVDEARCYGRRRKATVRCDESTLFTAQSPSPLLPPLQPPPPPPTTPLLAPLQPSIIHEHAALIA